MKLGILVNTNRHLVHVAGLTRAALAKGHEVEIFATDEGVLLLGDPGFTDLCQLSAVSMSACKHSIEDLGVSVDGLAAEIRCASQLRNAKMQHAADRVVVL
jgi:peroxiredoxin family protein